MMRRPWRALAALLLVTLAATAAHADKRIALTFDDIPRQRGAFFTPEERAARIIAGLKAAKVRQAAFFLNPGRLDTPDGQGGEARIAAYVAAGHVLANHTFSHPHLSETSAEDFLADIDRADAWIRGRKGERRWFRFPYLDEGGTDKAKRDAVRAGLKARGLRNGYVTADGSDWFLEDLTVQAAKAGKAMDMAQLRKLYLTIHVSGAEYYDVLARRTLGRSPAHVLLMHETDLAALFLPDLVAELRVNGWTIITADEAYRDALQDKFPDVPKSVGTLTGSLAWEKGVEPQAWPIWIHPGLAEVIFNQRVIKKAPAE